MSRRAVYRVHAIAQHRASVRFAGRATVLLVPRVLSLQASSPSLAELALALPWKMAQAVSGFLQPEATQPGGDGICIPLMSDDWLRQHQADCDKCGDVL